MQHSWHHSQHMHSAGPIIQQSKENWLALPLVFVFGSYGLWIVSMDAVSSANWPRFIFPIVMFVIGIFTVWIRYWKEDIYTVPADFSALWMLMWYNEFLGGVFGLVYLIQLLTYKE